MYTKNIWIMNRKAKNKMPRTPGIPACICLLLWAASACVTDQVLLDDTLPVAGLSFRVQGATPSTRAAATTAGQVNTAIVNGRITGAAGRSEVLVDGATLFRLKGTTNRFDYSPHAYFPSWATEAEFCAYSPATSWIGEDDFFISSQSVEADNTIHYTVPDPASRQQEDLLAAFRKVGEKDFMAPVTLNMHHVLSRVHVRARNQMIYPVIIEKLSLHNLYTSGKLDIDGDTWQTAGDGTVDINEGYAGSVTKHADYKTLWEPLGPKGSLQWMLPETGAVIPATQATEQVTADDQAMLVLPQTTQNALNGYVVTDDDDDFYLRVTYTIQNYGSNTVQCAYRDVNGLLPDAADMQGLTFEMGRQYALTIVFTAEAVTFDVSVDEWEEIK